MSDYVSEELIVEIFTRLPPKSLLRFRSLSKSWYSCISSPHFIRMHTSKSPQKLLFRHRYLHYEYAEFCTLHGYTGITPFQFPFDKHFCIPGSCNGIFCLHMSLRRFRLWNPSIRHIVTVPHCPERHYDLNDIGFGFDPISDDYKILVIGKSSYVYSMKTGAWSAIAPPTFLISHTPSKAHCVNGALHWVGDQPYIVTFDLNTHVFGTIPMPKSFPKVTELKKIGSTTIQGSLAVYATGYDDCWIWVRKDASWFVVQKWKTSQVGGNISLLLELTTNNDLLLYTYMEGFQVYNPKTGSKSRRIHNNADSHIAEIVSHVESLNLLETGTAWSHSY